jgi:hypothetical protein
VKPQLAFKNKPDNTTTAPWKPILTSKPHGTISLEQSLGTFTDDLGYQQYDYTTYLPFLLLRTAGQKTESMAKSQKKKKKKCQQAQAATKKYG